jgi:hypothetical protein
MMANDDILLFLQNMGQIGKQAIPTKAYEYL